MSTTPIDAELDLMLKRELAVPVNLVWRGLTEPELLKNGLFQNPGAFQIAGLICVLGRVLYGHARPGR